MVTGPADRSFIGQKSQPLDDLVAATTQAMPRVARSGGASEGLALGLGVIGCAGLGAVTFLMMHSHSLPKLPAPALARLHYAAPSKVESPAPAAPALFGVPIVVSPMIAAEPEGPKILVNPPDDSNTVRAPAMIIDNSTQAFGPDGPIASGTESNSSTAPTSGSTNASDRFAASLVGPAVNKASEMADPGKVVPQGTMIPAVLETAINSDLPGDTRAIVSRDIRSFDDTVVLIPDGSRLVGHYKSPLTTGETRAFIVWDRLIRPDGLSVQLASPATDDIGEAGTGGAADDHFVKQFGAPILLSIVNGLASGLGKGGTNTITTVVIDSANEAPTVAGKSLSANLVISPTVIVPQGTPIEVFASRDLDFGLENFQVAK